MKTVKFAADWTYRTPEVTIDYKKGDEVPVSAEIAEAATAAGVIEGGKPKADEKAAS